VAYIKNSLYLHYVREWKKQDLLVKNIHGVKMYLDLHDPGVSRTLAIKGTRERDQVHVVQQVLQPGMVVLDIGANIGSYALLEASLVGKTGRVYALEPSPENFDLLNKNVQLNQFTDIVETHNIGASNQSGIGQFYLHAASNLHTFHPVKYQAFGKQEAYVDTLEVEVVNILEFVKDKRAIDFIRMDIEGYEVEVLEGMMEGIIAGDLSPKILFEVHRPKYDDVQHNMRAHLAQLFEFGYIPRTLISTDESLARFREKGYEPQNVIRTDGVKRGLYEGISKEEAIEFICDIGFVRAVLLEKA